MEAKPHDSVLSLVEALTAEFPVLDSTQLRRYLGDVTEWNERIGLVSRQSTTATLKRLVRQSIHLYDLVSENGLITSQSSRPTVVDVGSGAGFPGLVWKLLDPALDLTIVERKQKKVTFLERTSRALRLEGVEVVEGDALEVSSYERFHEKFDLAISFAVGSPKEIAQWAESFLRNGGHFGTLRPKSERTPSGLVGKSLEPLASKVTEYGRLILYRKTAA